MQYLVILGRQLWEIRKNPHCSAECCLSLVLTLQEVGDVTAANPQPQLDTGTVDESFNLSDLIETSENEEQIGKAETERKDRVKRGHVNRK